MKQSKKGFTLVELMIVIVIIGILAAIIIPSVSSAIEKTKFANDQADAKNMNTILMTYCAEHNIDTKTLEAPEVRYIVSTGDKNYTFVPKAKDSVYWYNINEGKIEVIQTTSYETPTSMLNNVYADNFTGNSVEEIRSGYLYLNTTGELASLFAKIRGLNETDNFTIITEKATALGFKTHIEQFNPSQTLYISSTSMFHKCLYDDENKIYIKKVVFAENLNYIGIENNIELIKFDEKVEVQLPITIKVVDEMSFKGVLTETKFIAKNKNTKIYENALSDNIKKVSNIENCKASEFTEIIKNNNSLITVSKKSNDNDNNYTIIDNCGVDYVFLNSSIGRIDLTKKDGVTISNIRVDTQNLLTKCKDINSIDIKYIPKKSDPDKNVMDIIDIYVRAYNDNGLAVNIIISVNANNIKK